jgi:hypothetical protein
MAFEGLTVHERETVLRTGFGAGHSLKRMTQSVAKTGKACGINICYTAPEVTRRRLNKAGLIGGVKPY